MLVRAVQYRAVTVYLNICLFCLIFPTIFNREVHYTAQRYTLLYWFAAFFYPRSSLEYCCVFHSNIEFLEFL